MDPTTLAMMLQRLGGPNWMGAASEMDASGWPTPGHVMNLLQPNQILGDALESGAISGPFQPPPSTEDYLNQGWQAGMASEAPAIDPMQGLPLAVPEGGPEVASASAAAAPQTAPKSPAGNQWPNIRPPQQQKPVFSGGVAGAQKAPEMGVKAGTSPAQALMAALLGNRAGGGGKGQGGSQIPSLGALLNG